MIKSSKKKKDRKHCGEKEKLLITSNFSFSNSVFKTLELHVKPGLVWERVDTATVCQRFIATDT